MKTWLKQHKFNLSLLAFILMILAPLPMHALGGSGTSVLVWVLIGIAAGANFLVVLLP